MRKAGIVAIFLIAMFVLGSVPPSFGEIEHTSESLHHQKSSQTITPPLIPSNNSQLLTGWSGNLSPMPDYSLLEHDSYGNLYIAGILDSSVQLGNHTVTMPSQTKAIFVAKQNYSGSWDYIVNTTPMQNVWFSEISDISISGEGNVLVTGGYMYYSTTGRVYFSQNISFGKTSGNNEALAAMVTANGSWGWAKIVGANYGGTKSVYDSTDESFIIFSESCGTSTCSANVRKFNMTGHEVGGVSLMQTQGSIEPKQIVLTNGGDVVIYGDIYFPSNSQIYPRCGSNIISPNNMYEIFVAKLDLNWNAYPVASYVCDWYKISQTKAASSSSYVDAISMDINEFDEISIIGKTSTETTLGGHFFKGFYPQYTSFFLSFYSNGTSFDWSWNSSISGGQTSNKGFGGLLYNGSGKYVVTGVYDVRSTFTLYKHNKLNNTSISGQTFPTYSGSNGNNAQFALILENNSSIHDVLFRTSSYTAQLYPISLSHYPNGGIVITGPGTLINSSPHTIPLILQVNSRDFDMDGLVNEYDHCAMGEIEWNSTQLTDLDQDGCRDSGTQNYGRGEDTDDDNDGVLDPSSQHPTNFGLADRCPRNYLNWTSTASNDRDGDGCRDSDEDTDYDDDGVINSMDDCPNGSMYWINQQSYYDHDSDGCADFYIYLSYTNTWPTLYFNYPEEDFDDDNDGLLDAPDNCVRGVVNWTRTTQNDYDNDGCRDSDEDNDDDSDTVPDLDDTCPTGFLNWTSTPNLDFDGDGCNDNTEDADDDNDQIADTADACPKGDKLWVSDSSTDYDVDGCKDDTEDMDDDGDGISDTMDSCPKGVLNWVIQGDDYDDDGCRDSDEDSDDDNDGVLDQYDSCLFGDLGWIADVNTDHDLDGCYDYGEDIDDDNDGFQDDADNCPRGIIGQTSTPTSDYDGDGCVDLDEDLDDDNDGISDSEDDCKKGVLGWKSNASTDHDEDGCKDSEYEDQDDDADGVSDLSDDCPRGVIEWASSPFTDHDGDGCKDSDEDFDDDNDNVSDVMDLCHYGELNWVSSKVYTDYDEDGCKDLTEDLDDDNDGITDTDDLCHYGELMWLSTSLSDHDSDGCRDDSEDDDDDNDGILDLLDYCKTGEKNWDSLTSTDHDKDGCLDSVEDSDDDNDSIIDTMDDCNLGRLNWISNSTSDYDQDGCRDVDEDIDDDNDGVLDQFPDQCSKGLIGWVSNNVTDYDGDGCRDVEEDDDDDGDTVVDSEDECMMGLKDWLSSEVTDNDGDGCEDNVEDSDDDNDGLSDMLDECSAGEIDWLSKSTTDYDSDGCRDEGEDTDDDNDAIIDGDDICPKGYLGWVSSTALDYDSDGCHDTNEDSDDDNDGVLDAIELQEGTDPYNADSVPIESFSIQIGGVELSTWDLIGITTGLLSAGYLSFAFFTRNNRYERYLSEIKSNDEIDIKKLEKKLENASFFRLISPRQSIKLEDQLNLVIHKTKAEQQSNVEIDVKEAAKKESAVGTNPKLSLTGVMGDDGYEWLEYPEKSGKHYFRVPGENPWEKWE